MFGTGYAGFQGFASQELYLFPMFGRLESGAGDVALQIFDFEIFLLSHKFDDVADGNDADHFALFNDR